MVCAAASSYTEPLPSRNYWSSVLPVPNSPGAGPQHYKRKVLTDQALKICFVQLQQRKTDLMPAYWQVHECDELRGGNKSTFYTSPRAEHLVERGRTGVTTISAPHLSL